MTTQGPAIEIRNLTRRYGKAEAVHDLSLTVEKGRCYGFFGRNGAGKTTTIRCLLNLLRPTSGSVKVFGLDPRENEVEVKSRLSYVPDAVAFYPWMTVQEALDYLAAFRPDWNRKMEAQLLDQLRLSPDKKVNTLSKGQRTQLALIGAICAEPDLLVLDEPTSGLDPIVRREFIQAIIGAYQESKPGERTVFVSTHLISEFEGLIDEFTIVDEGKEILTSDADEARARFARVTARFPSTPPTLNFRNVRIQGREAEIFVANGLDEVLDQLKASSPEEVAVHRLTLEEIFIATVGGKTS